MELKGCISEIIPGIKNSDISKIVDVVHQKMFYQQKTYYEKSDLLINHWAVNKNDFTVLWKSAGGYGIETYTAKNKDQSYIKTRLSTCLNFWTFPTEYEAKIFLENELSTEQDTDDQEILSDEEELKSEAQELREIVALEVLPTYANEFASFQEAVEAAFDCADEFIRQSKNPSEKPDQIVDNEIKID